LKLLRYRWLRWRGYTVSRLVRVRLWDDLFANPPVVVKQWGKVEMRKGFRKRSIHFRRLSVEELEEALDGR
jgi:hypothetical protein